jgi:spore coat polysaccharide biosynthesis predicted glycosyltransferase SpsG
MKLYNDLEQVQNLNIILNGKKISKKIFWEKYSDLINIKFENLINEILYIKENILKNIKQEYEKYNLSMEAINLIYKYYYYELIINFNK